MLFNRLHPAARLPALAILAAGLAGCQGVTGIQPTAQVRVIDASPDAPPLDIYQNAQAGLYNLGFGTVTSYIPVAPGAYTHSADVAGSQQQLAQVRANLAPGAQYTLLTGNIAANLQMAVLKDQSLPAPSGQVALRFLGQATHSGPVDVYLQPAGFSLAGAAPVAAAVSFGTNTGYFNVPSGTYSIAAYPAGSAPTATQPIYSGSQVAYPATSVHTILLLDHPVQPTAGPSIEQISPSLQIITANDYDPASAS